MRDVDEHPALARQFEQFARTVARDGGALYAGIASRAAVDDGLLGLLDGAAPDQRRPLLLLAAVHFLLLGGAEHPLAAHYPSVLAVRGAAGDGAPAPGDAADHFADFCATHRDAVRSLVATRATQTNEVGRCAALLPALATVQQRSGRALALLDLGASAGLNLLFDRYHYRYDGEAARRVGDPRSPVTVRCTLRGASDPPLHLPEVTWRAGIDLSPVDPADADQARWLLACQWPHDLERFGRQRAALGLAAALAPHERPVVHRGDLLDALVPTGAGADPDADLCLFHSWVAAYLRPDQQERLVAAVDALSARRTVWWLYAESPFEVPALPAVAAPAGHVDRAASAVVLVRVEDGRRQARRLADMHHHGTWLHWWGW